jgi:hypothetical protein
MANERCLRRLRLFQRRPVGSRGVLKFSVDFPHQSGNVALNGALDMTYARAFALLMNAGLTWAEADRLARSVGAADKVQSDGK